MKAEETVPFHTRKSLLVFESIVTDILYAALLLILFRSVTQRSEERRDEKGRGDDRDLIALTHHGREQPLESHDATEVHHRQGDCQSAVDQGTVYDKGSGSSI